MHIEQINPKKEEFYDLITDPNVFVIRLTQRKEYVDKNEDKKHAPTTRVYDGMGISRMTKTRIDELLDALTNPEKAIVRITMESE